MHKFLGQNRIFVN